MPGNGNVNLTIADGGAIVTVPAANLQLVMGCCQQGLTCTANQPAPIFATRNVNNLLTQFGYGPLTEAAGMAIRDGATVLALRLPTTTAGAIVAGSAKTISAATHATPIVITATAHGMTSGMVATVAAVGGNTNANGTWIVTKIDADTLSLNGSAGAADYTSGGTITWTGSIMTGPIVNGVPSAPTSTAAAYFTGTPFDDVYPFVNFPVGGTTGTAGIQFTASLDANRQTNLPRVSLGTALTYAIPQSGLTLHVVTGKTIAAGDNVRCVCTAPLPAVADITTAMACVLISPYASSGWGSTHLLGQLAASDAGTISTNLETWATGLLYQRMMGHARDAHAPTGWGGDGESDATWSASLLADYASTTSRRLGVAAGYYNMRGVISNPICGLPLYRRPLSWAWAARTAGQLPKRADLESWVRLGALSQITEDPVNDPLDGFVYHDENAGFVFDNKANGAGRMTAARHHPRRTSWFLSTPITLASTGSDYQIMARGRTMDDVSDIIQDVATPDIHSRVKLNRNGTIRESDAVSLENAQMRAIDDNLADQISGRTIVVDRDYNVQQNEKLHITGSIEGDGYVLQIDETVGFATVQQ